MSAINLRPLPAFAGGEGSPAERMKALRQLVAEKFPTPEVKPASFLPTGLPQVDDAEGGLRRAALTEFCGASGAGALFLHALVSATCRQKCFAALVDAARTFEPVTCPAAVLERLLLVFCADAMQAVKAADLLLRDGNFSLVMLDCQSVPPRQLRRIPANVWHRLQRLAEQTTAAFVALTPEPMIEAARVRIAGLSQWTLTAQRRWRRQLLVEAPWRVIPRHILATDAPEHEDHFATA